MADKFDLKPIEEFDLKPAEVKFDLQAVSDFDLQPAEPSKIKEAAVKAIQVSGIPAKGFKGLAAGVGRVIQEAPSLLKRAIPGAPVTPITPEEVKAAEKGIVRAGEVVEGAELEGPLEKTLGFSAEIAGDPRFLGLGLINAPLKIAGAGLKLTRPFVSGALRGAGAGAVVELSEQAEKERIPTTSELLQTSILGAAVGGPLERFLSKPRVIATQKVTEQINKLKGLSKETKQQLLNTTKAFQPKSSVDSTINRFKDRTFNSPEEYMGILEKEGVKVIPNAPSGLADHMVKMEDGTVKGFIRLSQEELATTIPRGAQPRVTQTARNAMEGSLQDFQPGFTQQLRGTVSRLEQTEKGLSSLSKPLQEQFFDGTKRDIIAREEMINVIRQFKARFGFTPRSKESAFIQYVGEKFPDQIAAGKSPKVLTKKFGKEKAQKITDAANWMRSNVYDPYWVSVNKVRASNGLDPIPYRKDYFTHFEELGFLEEMGILSKGTKAQIKEATDVISAADINRIRFRKLTDVLFPFRKRKLGAFTFDAVGGMERYLGAATRVKHLQPHINELSLTSKALKEANPEKYPNLIKFLDQQATYLSGGKEPVDLFLETFLGNTGMRAVTGALNNWLKSLIVLNPGVPFAQLIGLGSPIVEHGAIKTGQSIATQIFSPRVRQFIAKNSRVVQDRRLDAHSRNLYPNIFEKIGGPPLDFADRGVVMSEWWTHFKSGIHKGLGPKAAIRNAEVQTAKAQAFTVRANTPEKLRSKAFQLSFPLMNQAMAFTTGMWDKHLAPAVKAGTVTRTDALKAMRLLGAYAFYTAGSYQALGRSSLQPTDFIPGVNLLARSPLGVLDPIVKTTRSINAMDAAGTLRNGIQTVAQLGFGVPISVIRGADKFLFGPPQGKK